jgi:hypothetical protein
MPTPASIIAKVAALMNDAPQDVYTNVACLPYFNMALSDCGTEFQLNGIPSSESFSTVIEVDAGVTTISFSTTPALPSDLVEIKEVWECQRDTDNWTPMVRKDFLPHYLENMQIGPFRIWSFTEEALNVPGSNQDNDLKLDYVRNIFSEITIGTININLSTLRIEGYLRFRTAAYCAYFIGENESRAQILADEATLALGKSLGISIKGRQAIRTRHRPFRAAYKQRRLL